MAIGSRSSGCEKYKRPAPPKMPLAILPFHPSAASVGGGAACPSGGGMNAIHVLLSALLPALHQGVSTPRLPVQSETTRLMCDERVHMAFMLAAALAGRQEACRCGQVTRRGGRPAYIA